MILISVYPDRTFTTCLSSRIELPSGASFVAVSSGDPERFNEAFKAHVLDSLDFAKEGRFVNPVDVESGWKIWASLCMREWGSWFEIKRAPGCAIAPAKVITPGRVSIPADIKRMVCSVICDGETKSLGVVVNRCKKYNKDAVKEEIYEMAGAGLLQITEKINPANGREVLYVRKI